ncbi:MAG: hypothetical protein ACRD0K_04290 [Egibacteraceae bacterium]
MGLLVAIAVIGAGSWVFAALRGTGDVLVSLLPADIAGYATVCLDPAAGQKRALFSLVSRLQDVGPVQVEVEDPAASLDGVLADVGLTSDDVMQAAGTQIAVAGWYRFVDSQPLEDTISPEMYHAAHERAMRRRASPLPVWIQDAD